MIGVPEAWISARPGFLWSMKRDLTNRSHARCEPSGSTPFSVVRLVAKDELSELLRLVDDQLVDADLLDRQHVVARGP